MHKCLKVFLATAIISLVIIATGCGGAAAPQISNIESTDVTQYSATITWDTDKAATSQVEYGTTTDYGSSTKIDATDITLASSHSVTITGLEPNTTYHYRVKSKDANNNEAVAEDTTFTTEAVPPPDTTAPDISNIEVTDITYDGAAITWETDERATSRVEYGTSTAYGSSEERGSSRTSYDHDIYLGPLEENTTYHYRIKSEDEAGNEAVSADYTFTTPISRGTVEARKTEKMNVTVAIAALMADSEIGHIPNPVTVPTNDMSMFPDVLSDDDDGPDADGLADKATDPSGTAYDFVGPPADKKGYVLWDHDNDAGDTGLERYTSVKTTAYWYTVDEDSTVHQWSAPGGVEYTD